MYLEKTKALKKRGYFFREKRFLLWREITFMKNSFKKRFLMRGLLFRRDFFLEEISFYKRFFLEEILSKIDFF